jgi:hypothetical protein
VKQFYGVVNAAKGLPERVKLPPAPVAPSAPRGFLAGAANTVGLVLGVETQHQRAIQDHANAMAQWRETCKELRQQDAKAWDTMKALSVAAPLSIRQVPGIKSGPIDQQRLENKASVKMRKK